MTDRSMFSVSLAWLSSAPWTMYSWKWSHMSAVIIRLATSRCTKTAPSAACLCGAGRRSGGQHALEYGRVLCAVSAEAELAGDVDRADRGGGPDPVIARGRREDVAAGRADAERADAARVGLGPGGQARDGRLEVLDPVGRVFKAAGSPPLSPW